MEAMVSMVSSDSPQVLEILQLVLNPSQRLYTLGAVESTTFFSSRSNYSEFEFVDPKVRELIWKRFWFSIQG
jgi:hypothetical protein